MKNKKAIYILLPAVILIWGLVAYRIYSSVSDEKNIPITQSNIFAEKPAIVNDTFSIHNNYRDPFLDKTNLWQAQEIGNSNPVKQTEVVKEVKQAEVIRWPVILFSGLVKNQKSNKQIVLMTINGTSHLMKQGEQIAGISLTKVYKDSVEVTYEKEKKVIKK